MILSIALITPTSFNGLPRRNESSGTQRVSSSISKRIVCRTRSLGVRIAVFILFTFIDEELFHLFLISFSNMPSKDIVLFR